MSVRAGLKWVAREGTGVGVQQRLARVILGRPGPGSNPKAVILQQFLDSASAVVLRFGPFWAQREAGGRPVGAWLLACFWVVGLIFLPFVPIYW